ncbi:uncharacterized protein LOC132894785 [Neoarius graeffei]|uniref:uncharacterized protein LOC132894785 n=1 Tax=Neoarius graeffei TaxID=443677 RepID=UPI00298D3D95|nr:uncharacterized protein LOC132894785 [Neoarius graeffei]
MWAEYDLGPGVSCLESWSEPTDGKVYRMYHGTSRQAAAQIMRTGFKQSAGGMLGRGVYLSRDLKKARRYPLHLRENERVVIRVRVKVGRVKKIDYQGHPLQKTWHDHGYDTAWCPPRCGMVWSGLEEDCVWDPSRIEVIDIIHPRTISGTFFEDCMKVNTEEPANGRVYRMYHGTSPQAAAEIMRSGFKQSAGGMLGRGVYLSRDLNKASRYPLELSEHQRVVIRVKVNVGRVKKIDYQGHPLQKTWHDKGFDTAWCPPGCGMVPSGLEEDCVWDPSRIRVIDIIRPSTTSGAFYDHTSVNIMWAEDDLRPGIPCLESGSEPDNGRVYRMYHGTSADAAAKIMTTGFKQSEDGMLGRGVYLSRDLNKASRYPLELPEHQRVVIMVKVNVGRVKKIEYQGHPLQKTWHDHGYDTAWCPPRCGMVPSGLEEDCVWDPSRIEVINIIHPSTTSGASQLKIRIYRELSTLDFNGYLLKQVKSSQAVPQQICKRVVMARAFPRLAKQFLADAPAEVKEFCKDMRPGKHHVKRFSEVTAIGSPQLRVISACDQAAIHKVKDIPTKTSVKYYRRMASEYSSLNTIMWAEDDLNPGIPCLESWSEPANGRVYRMYHGTSPQAAAEIMRNGFKQSEDGMLGRGVYLSRDLDKASRYPLKLPEHQRVVIRVRVNVGRVKKIDSQRHPLQKTWHDHGYDTAWCPPGCGMVRSGLEEDCVWDPSRIEVIKIIRPRTTSGPFYDC